MTFYYFLQCNIIFIAMFAKIYSLQLLRQIVSPKCWRRPTYAISSFCRSMHKKSANKVLFYINREVFCCANSKTVSSADPSALAGWCARIGGGMVKSIWCSGKTFDTNSTIGNSMEIRECQQYSKTTNCAVPLIVGGTEVSPHEYPHMALIGFGSQPVWDCGGTLISEQHVLTAAHCSASTNNGPATNVKLGMTKKSEVGDGVQVVRIAQMIVHPSYKKPLKYNDIAIVRLASPVTFTANIQPACLDFLHKDNAGVNVLTATGFGKTSFGDDGGTETMSKVELPVLHNKDCDPYFKTFRKTVLTLGLNDQMICAGVLTGGKDTCAGDSGGPLQTYWGQPYCRYAVIGVTSFGKYCGYAKSPAVYTKVSAYLPWIEKHVWP